LATSYTPRFPENRRWSDISSNLNIRPGRSRNLNLKVGNSINPYLWKVLTTRITYGLNVGGKFDTGGEVPELEPERRQSISQLQAAADTAFVPPEGTVPDQLPEDLMDEDFPGFQRPLLDPTRERDPTEGGRFIPWNASASLSYSRNHVTDANRATANLTISTALTRNLEFTYRTSVDFVTGQFLRQEWAITRDLHCWRLEFTRILRPNNPEFGFRIYLLSIPSLQVTRGNDQLLGALPGGMGGGIY